MAVRTRPVALTSSFMIIAGLSGISGIAAAQDAPSKSQAVAAASVSMPSLAEDFAYPGADQILKDQQIELKRGDGHITLTSCDTVADIQVKSRTGSQKHCFDVNAPKGYVTLEIPDAYGIWTEDYAVQATVTADGTKTVVEAPANDYKTFGEAGTSRVKSVLVELRVGS